MGIYKTTTTILTATHGEGDQRSGFRSKSPQHFEKQKAKGKKQRQNAKIKKRLISGRKSVMN